MAFALIFMTISAVVLFSQDVVANAQINEPSQYAATAIPKDPSSARQALGYNKYDGNQNQRSDKSVLYGNNWEQYDQNVPQQQNQYYGSDNQFQQPYRYYRSVVVY